MEIPVDCELWEEGMLDGEESQLILENIYSEECIDEGVVDQFFDLISEECEYRQDFSPGEAKILAKKIVSENSEFILQGREIVNQFNELLRFESVHSIPSMFPAKYLDRFGLSEDQIKNDKFEEEDLYRIFHGFEGELEVGNLLGIAWITDGDHNDVDDLKNSPDILVDRLGLEHHMSNNHCLLLSYGKNENSIRINLPRVFDGIDWGKFNLIDDCEADAGLTEPVNTEEYNGLPEAVHEKQTVNGSIRVVNFND